MEVGGRARITYMRTTTLPPPLLPHPPPPTHPHAPHMLWRTTVPPTVYFTRCIPQTRSSTPSLPRLYSTLDPPWTRRCCDYRVLGFRVLVPKKRETPTFNPPWTRRSCGCCASRRRARLTSGRQQRRRCARAVRGQGVVFFAAKKARKAKKASDQTRVGTNVIMNYIITNTK
jgi:hypothetical protein